MSNWHEEILEKNIEHKVLIEKAWGNDILKGEHSQHKYIRKEGDKYIYEEGKSKEPSSTTQMSEIDSNMLKRIESLIKTFSKPTSKEELNVKTNDFIKKLNETKEYILNKYKKDNKE